MALHTPVYMQPVAGDAAINYSAQEWRQLTGALVALDSGGTAQGVTLSGDYKAVQRAAGANFSVDVGAGVAFVLGDDVTGQGLYAVWNDGTVNVPGFTVPGSGTFNHRLVLQVQDKLNNGTWTGYQAALTPLLDTGAGTPAEPNSAITLALIQVAAGQASILNANITDYRQRLAGVGAVKTADLGRTHATTLTNDPDLQLLNLAASATYGVDAALFYTGGSGAAEGDFAWQFALSAGSGGSYGDTHLSPAGNFGGFGASTWGTQHGAQTTGTGNLQVVMLTGTYTTGAAPASLILQWAQNTDTGTATTLKANSYLRAKRLT